jgi:hypothetical protein
MPARPSPSAAAGPARGTVHCGTPGRRPARTRARTLGRNPPARTAGVRGGLPRRGAMGSMLRRRRFVVAASRAAAVSCASGEAKPSPAEPPPPPRRLNPNPLSFSLCLNPGQTPRSLFQPRTEAPALPTQDRGSRLLYSPAFPHSTRSTGCDRAVHPVYGRAPDTRRSCRRCPPPRPPRNAIHEAASLRFDDGGRRITAPLSLASRRLSTDTQPLG